MVDRLLPHKMESQLMFRSPDQCLGILFLALCPFCPMYLQYATHMPDIIANFNQLIRSEPSVAAFVSKVVHTFISSFADIRAVRHLVTLGSMAVTWIKCGSVCVH